ncbi:hypothetical protein C1H46_004286 [Malus baccata]|uniref:Uncharacterized protein n=1 Tax=Malus baccata TaxID=106549 RepID=A0A540NGH4_MALBA|nr:hypothetical protein C1H46_004286 [Malus baccata]
MQASRRKGVCSPQGSVLTTRGCYSSQWRLLVARQSDYRKEVSHRKVGLLTAREVCLPQGSVLAANEVCLSQGMCARYKEV